MHVEHDVLGSSPLIIATARRPPVINDEPTPEHVMLSRVAKYLFIGVPLLACGREAAFSPPPSAYSESKVVIEGEASEQTIARIDSTFFGRNLPELGRKYIPQDYGPDASPSAILSHAFWSERFNSRPEIIGSELEIDGVVRRIVGVMPRGIDVPQGVALWVPRI